MYFGIAHLLGYPIDYPEMLYRFADFNAGWYASRNAAFQKAVSRATGIPLALDGDLVPRGAGVGYPPGATERAVRTLAGHLRMGEAAIRRGLEQQDAPDFAGTALYTRVFELAEAIVGEPLPRAVVPQIALQSPKITRDLTTEWFATRVQTRHTRCLGRGGGSS